MEEIPKRLVVNRTTGEERYANYKWVRQEGRTTEEVLLLIREEIDRCMYYQDVDDLLYQATTLIWVNFPDPENNRLYKDLSAQKDKLSGYNKEKSQKRKIILLQDVIAEARFCIQYYFRFGKNEMQ